MVFKSLIGFRQIKELVVTIFKPCSQLDYYGTLEVTVEEITLSGCIMSFSKLNFGLRGHIHVERRK